jgi:hypothetical protein
MGQSISCISVLAFRSCSPQCDMMLPCQLEYGHAGAHQAVVETEANPTDDALGIRPTAQVTWQQNEVKSAPDQPKPRRAPRQPWARPRSKLA